MDVIAEGIETKEQLVLLQSLDCNYGQGYLFSRPVPAEKADAFLGADYRFVVPTVGEEPAPTLKPQKPAPVAVPETRKPDGPPRFAA
jgi:hypothetical protein